MKVPFQTVDVFTDRKFGGNPLAVIPDAQGLTAEQMQSIAAEFNLAETTFVLPPRDPKNTAHVRIFTPKSELPFAGHPNVGTAFVLARHGRSGDRFVFEEGAGLVPIDLARENGAVVAARLAAPQPLSVGETVAAEIVAQAAGVQLTVGHQITMLLTLMLTSKGVAGVPRASLVILAGTLASYGLPLEGVTLILGVDELMDMARTMTNVIGNCLATVVIAKWEGEFVEATDQQLELAAARGEI